MKILKLYLKQVSLAIVLFLFLISNTHSQKSLPVKVNPLKADTNSGATSVPQNKELELYKLLYENAKDANKDLHESLQWTIGIVIGFILLVLGSQYFFNIRMNEEKLNRIKSDINSDFEILKSTLNLEIDSALTKELVEIKKLGIEAREGYRESMKKTRQC